MKNIALVLFGILALAIAALVVLIATLPTAKVTIQAIGPTGNFGTRTNKYGGVVSGPEWLFRIENVGRATASCNAVVEVRRSDDTIVVPSPTTVDSVEGLLEPGEGFVTKMIVASGDKSECRGHLSYDTFPTQFQRRLWNLGFKMPYMESFLWRRVKGSYSEPSWHPMTNATMASSTVTNTP